ncbi:MAG: diaminopimelate epimerase [Bifidobacteriaceae bacterium]|nr:diaminopimelate epimerase [Bifidobacteriaceae bacterium]
MSNDLTGSLEGFAFAKGHGAGNDFVLYSDPAGQRPLSAQLARALADRHFGIGADGVIRAVRCANLADGAAAASGGAEWFMDYRNADGSLAEMCGNGIRVFVEFLLAEGLATLADSEAISIGTRAGLVLVRREDQIYAVDLGKWRFSGGQAAVRRGGDREVATSGADTVRPGLSVDVGNPHVVVQVGPQELAGLDLTVPPTLTPAPPGGANVEFMVVDQAAAAITLRVHERGSGETLSCGTGAAAAALAAWAWSGAGAPATWQVRLPGGQLRVRMVDDVVELAGPAELVFAGRLGQRAAPAA